MATPGQDARLKGHSRSLGQRSVWGAWWLTVSRTTDKALPVYCNGRLVLREIDARELGEHSVFATVHWNALDGDGNVVRDTWTSNQLLATSDGWRTLSYTNHF